MQKNHEIKTKAVSFNILDPDQKALLDHALKRKNFSSYVKRLIQRDIDCGFNVVQKSEAHTESILNVPRETCPKNESSFNPALMNGLI